MGTISRGITQNTQLLYLIDYFDCFENAGVILLVSISTEILLGK